MIASNHSLDDRPVPPAVAAYGVRPTRQEQAGAARRPSAVRLSGSRLNQDHHLDWRQRMTRSTTRRAGAGLACAAAGGLLALAAP
ncbi:hypothetical protein, partial [Actinomadura kijaniata]|uniref:hypothetical protein n=1 Tax=Actinomadura kijaniata TaxID=46161 RepID=UPI001C3F30DF